MHSPAPGLQVRIFDPRVENLTVATVLLRGALSMSAAYPRCDAAVRQFPVARRLPGEVTCALPRYLGCERMADDPSADLVKRWQAGDQQAAAELFRRYANRLVMLARSRLSRSINQHVDAEDVVQSVCRIFFAKARDNRYELQRGGDLWQLLVTMTLDKLKNQAKRFHQAKRDVNRQQNYGNEDSLLDLQPQVLAREPTPLETVVLTDLLQQTVRNLDSLGRRVFELRLQGHKLEEIAKATDVSERTVCRILEEVKQQLEQLGLRQSRS